MKTISVKMGFLITLFVLAALACSFGSSGSGDSGNQTTTDLEVLFKDDFSNTNSGWDRVQDDDGINDYVDGGYRILVNKENWYFWSNPGLNFSDVIIDVDAKKIGGPDDNDFGVICRYKDNSNFYFFTVSSDGYYGISKIIDGEEFMIGMDSLQFNDKVVNLGAASNHIQASCIGNSLTLKVNNTTLADVKDSDLTSGDVGLIAGTYDEIGTDILFDSFVVSKP